MAPDPARLKVKKRGWNRPVTPAKELKRDSLALNAENVDHESKNMPVNTGVHVGSGPFSSLRVELGFGRFARFLMIRVHRKMFRRSDWTNPLTALVGKLVAVSVGIGIGGK